MQADSQQTDLFVRAGDDLIELRRSLQARVNGETGEVLPAEQLHEYVNAQMPGAPYN